MRITRLSTKGQIVLPKDLCVSRAWGPGSEFTIAESGDGVLLRPARRFPATQLADVAGCLPSKRKAVSTARMSDAAGLGVERRHGSGRY